MTKVDFSHHKNNPLHPRRYRLQRTLEDLMRRNPHEFTRMLLDQDSLHIHAGAAVALEYAAQYLEDVKKELEDRGERERLLGCIVYGGVARGLRTDSRPKDVDMIFIMMPGTASIRVKKHPRIEPFFYGEDMMTHKMFLKDDEQSSFIRRTFALPIIIMYERDQNYISNLRDIARKTLHLRDIRAYIDFQVSKRKKEAPPGEEVPEEKLRQVIIEELDIMDELRGIL